MLQEWKGENHILILLLLKWLLPYGLSWNGVVVFQDAQTILWELLSEHIEQPPELNESGPAELWDLGQVIPPNFICKVSLS